MPVIEEIRNRNRELDLEEFIRVRFDSSSRQNQLAITHLVTNLKLDMLVLVVLILKIKEMLFFHFHRSSSIPFY